ncbi:helix-turn-helix domain-containing protein [Clostridium estertheticum]|uniref:helix-turn-helix domain-containing protein n=1 Tax=Clostridium estertheticum TaxID=238834 RepID=UPI001CF28F00|nr:helix-turn-helix transcriptional regulator [Clostridium estertheticum]MCB2309258.1 helix-turn-helix domain-containing protein [Clostridium estertheticum]MCB2346791.1 helix-turn-helix domain-containing protein [Clostridium estertheticum]MCB2352231.1 helix-turn-helix domain-containing protein [Clostridium estertheticum]WAG48564.1 helix-turn-helix domain-containing protein [Clostridium estertheticum]
MSTFNTDKALLLYNKGLAYSEISKKLNVKGSTLRMFFSKNINLGKIKKRQVTVRKKLKEIRLQKKLTQKDVADLAEITRAYYTRIENHTREPSYRVVKKIKSALEYENDDLFDIYKNEEKI